MAAKIIDISGKPMNGSKPHVRAGHAVVYTVPALPDDPADLDTVASGLEAAGVSRPSEAFMVAMCRALAKALARLHFPYPIARGMK